MPSKTKAELAAENARLREQLAELERRRSAPADSPVPEWARQLEAIRSVSEEIAREMRLPVLLELIVQHAIRLVGGANGSVLLWDEGRQLLMPAVWIGREPASLGTGIGLGMGLTGLAAKDRKGLIVNDYRRSPYARSVIMERTKITAGMAEPLLYQDRLVGVINIDNGDTGRTFADEHGELLRHFATQAAIAIENARAHEAALLRGEQLEALLRASQTVMSDLDLQTVLEQIVAEACRISRCTQVKLLLVDREAQVLRVSIAQGVEAPPDLPWPLGRGLSGRVARTGEPLFIADSQDDALNPNAAFDRAKGLRTYLGLPIKAGNEVLGVLTFNTTEPREYSAAELAYLTSFADQAAIAIQNARLFAAAEQAARKARSLYEVAQSLTTSLDPLEILHLITVKTAELLGTPHAQVVLWDEATQSLRLGAVYGILASQVQRQVFRLGEGVTGVVAQSRTPLIVNDYQDYPSRVKELTDIVADIAVPLLYRGRFLGVLGSHTIQPGAVFTADHLNLLTSFANQAAVALENARLYEATQRELAERTRAEAALQEKTEELDRFFTMALDLLCIADTAGYFRRVNPAWSSILGYEPRELEGRRFLDFVHPDDISATLAAVGDLAAQREVVNFVNRYRCKDGSYRWIEWRSCPYRGSLIYAAARDITDRKAAEEALRKSEERLALAMEAGNDALFDVDMTTGTAYVSPRYFTMLGYGPAELPAHLDTWASLLHPEDRASALAAMAEYAEGKSDSHEIEFRLRAKSGDWRWILSRGHVVARDAAGRPLRLVGTHVDITERKQAEEERRQFETRMQHAQKLESLGVLAGGIAHDFNNLLVAILGHAELALLELSPASPARSHLQAIETASHRAADLCKQMLAYSGKGRFMVETIDLSDVVREMAHMLEVAVSKKASLRYDLASRPPAIQADITQIRQVIMNLITNASEAIGDRSGFIRVTTGALHCDRAYLQDFVLTRDLAEGPYVYLEVSDSGCGMDEATQDKIFDPFFSTKFAGRGLGLAAVLGIVRGHKGAIKVYTEEGKGTTFKLLFPAAADPAIRVRSATAAVDEWRGQGLVLLVDDEPSVRETGRKLLESLGFTVLTAPDGGQALEVFRGKEREIACVLLDLTMPHMDGEETFRELRRLRSDVRVVLSSGYSQQDLTQRFVGKRLAGFIQKPYRLEELRRTLREALEPPPAPPPESPRR